MKNLWYRFQAWLVALLGCLALTCQSQTYWVTNSTASSTDFQARDSGGTPTYSVGVLPAGGVISFEGDASWGVGSFTAASNGWVISPFDWGTNGPGFFNIGSGGASYTSDVASITATTIFLSGFFAFLLFFIAGTHFRLFGRVADA